MLLQDECRPFFDAIRRALEKKGDMPRALEALHRLQEAREAVAQVDARERYLAEALTRQPGTILIYIEGDAHRPVRKRVLGVTADHVLVDWQEVRLPKKRFSAATGVSLDSSRPHLRDDVLDLAELRDLLASLPRAPA